MTKVGFIGLGVMGKRMAKNLLKAGHELVVHNRSFPPVEEMVKLGAASAPSPADVGRECEVVILSLPTGDAVREVVLGRKGVVQGLSPRGIVIDTSTIDPEMAVCVADELKARQCYFLDAPVSGGPEGAEAGTLSMMIGGERSAFESCKDVLEKMGKSVFYLGDSGSGQKMKLINQALCSSYFIVVADAFRLSKKMNVQEEDMLRVISRSWGDSPVFRHFLAVVGSGQYDDGARIGLYRKDLSIISSIVNRQKLSIPILELVQSYFEKASQLGYQNLDASYMHVLLERIASSSA